MHLPFVMASVMHAEELMQPDPTMLTSSCFKGRIILEVGTITAQRTQ